MTEADKVKALKILAATEAVTGMDLSTVRWGVSRQQADAEPGTQVEEPVS